MIDNFMLLIHIAAGLIAVLSGAAALGLRKGSPPHRVSGRVFVLAMIATGASGAYVAFFLPQMITFLAGLFTCYLVLSGWRAARAQGGAGPAEIIAILAALSIGTSGVFFGLEALGSEDGLKDGFSAGPYFFFGGLALLAAILDGSVLIRRGVTGAQRVARHLWRMCFALFIAAGSLFTGPGAEAFPEALQGSPLLSAPELIILGLMLFWLTRVLLAGRRWRKAPAGASAE